MKNIRKNKNSENEIAVTGKSGIFWLKGLAGLLAVMLVFTIASRVVASITVPQVTASAAALRLPALYFSSGNHFQAEAF